MASALGTLHRLRANARKASDVDLRRAELERDRQQVRVEAGQAALVAAREARDDADLESLATWHAFRLQGELKGRREDVRLAQREREVDARRSVHVGHVKDELAVQNLIDRREAVAAEQAGRRERTEMDEIAGRTRSDP